MALWITSVYGAYSIALKVTKNKWLIALISAILCTALDILIEPLCKDLGYWAWKDSVGIYNFVCWFILAFLMSNFLSINRIQPQKEAIINYFWQIIFFLFINFSLYGELQY